jgi:ABC-type nitrate/sulfonate/bicarbonate transport system substrate-binding protein
MENARHKIRFALHYKAIPGEGAMMKRLLAAVVTAAFALTGIPGTTRAEDTKLVVIVSPGVPNLPIFAAQAKGFFAKRGLDIDVRFTPNSEELRNGLAEGRYQIAHAAIDNAFAMKDKANVDVAVVSGGDNSFNHLIVQPEIMSLADIKGKTVVVDAVNTAYAFQLYEMLRQNGLKQGDYQVHPVGGTTLRLETMIKDKAMVAAMMNPPFSIRAQKAGLRSMGTAAAALGAYQGTSAFVLRKWGQANADALVRYLQAYIEGVRWTLNIANKPEAVALMIERLKLSDDVAAQAYDVATNPKAGFDRDAALNLEGVKNVLRLRAQFEGGKPAAPDMYIELSYYQKAMAGL